MYIVRVMCFVYISSTTVTILKQVIAILHLLNDVSMLQRASFSSYSNCIYIALILNNLL